MSVNEGISITSSSSSLSSCLSTSSISEQQSQQQGEQQGKEAPPLMQQQSIFTFSNLNDNTNSIETPPESLDIDPNDVQLIQDTINRSGISACGIMGIDVWIFNDEDERLYHFGDGVNWVNPVYRVQLMGEIEVEDDGDLPTANRARERLNELDRLTDPSHPRYYHPIPQPNGVGLAGNYWQQFGDIAISESYFQQPLIWRVASFTTHPDQFPVERVIGVEKAFGKCAGVPFNIFGKCKGVVLYFARETAEDNFINSPTNSIFLRMASYHIGCTLATSCAKVMMMRTRRGLLPSCCDNGRSAFNSFKVIDSNSMRSYNDSERFDGSLHGSIALSEIKLIMPMSLIKFVKKKARKLKEKSIQPPNLKPPPPDGFSTSFWSFGGCFTSLIVLFGIHFLFKSISNGEFTLVMPPFGALLTLQYALTAAPASQPRNSILGFTLSLTTVMIIKFLMHHILKMPQWFHVSLGTSLAVALMQKTGTIHPPAGAGAFVFASSSKDMRTDIISILMFMFADIVIIFLAVIINNLSDMRQYPMYWNILTFGSKGKHTDEEGTKISRKSGRAKDYN